MEWDLDPQAADQLRDEAKKSTRIRIINDNLSSSSCTQEKEHKINPTSSSQPKPGEYCLVELQGELVYPDNEEGSLFVNMNSKNNEDEDENESSKIDMNKRYVVGKIVEDDVKAAKTKTMLRMGTLFVEGERLKIPGPTLVLVDRVSNKNSAANTINNKLPPQFNETSFTLQHQQSKTTRRGREDEDQDDEEFALLREVEEERHQQEQQGQRNGDAIANNQQQQQQQPATAPPISEWKLGSSVEGEDDDAFSMETTTRTAIIGENDLLQSLDKCTNDDTNDESHQEGQSKSYYCVKGVLAQKYFFKAKPARQTKAA